MVTQEVVMSDNKQLPPIKEKDFLSQVKDLAMIYHWRVYHPFLSTWSEKGYPDNGLLLYNVSSTVASQAKQSWFPRRVRSLNFSWSNAETTFSMIKGKFGGSVRSKSPIAQVNEVLCKVLCHNICVLIQSIYELGIEPTFWAESLVAQKVTLNS